MKNLKIGTKILLGFGVIFFLVVAIVVSVAISNASVLRETRNVRALNELNSAAFDTHDRFFMSRIQASNFISNPSVETWNAFLSLYNEAILSSERGLEIIRLNPVLLEYYESWNQMGGFLDSYLLSMENVRTAFAQADEAGFILDELGPEIETVVIGMYDAQVSTTRDQIDRRDPPSELNIKMSRIDDTVQINNLKSLVRLNTATLTENFNTANAAALVESVDSMRVRLEEYISVLRTQTSIDIAQGVVDSLDEYQRAVEVFISEQNTVVAESAAALRDGEEVLVQLMTKVNDFQARLESAILLTESSSRSTLIIVLIIAGVTAILSVVIALVIKGVITRPIIALSKFLNKAGTTGDITIDANEQKDLEVYSRSKDEVGQMIMSCSAFVNHVTNISEELKSLATGDLTTDFAVISDVDTMGISVQQMVDSLNDMFHNINTSAVQVSSGSRQVADGAQALAQGSTEQSASVEALSNSISEIAEKTKANTQMAEDAAKLADSIISSAEKGSRQMDEMINAVSEINDASQSISKVMKSIDDIAFQTNILSLNAAVEAARAGQHGKGFAVVAEEVRNLAAKSAQSAKETSSLIQNAIEKSELGVKIAADTSESLNEIVSGINESNKLSGMIAKSSDEQLEGISQINSGIDQVAQVVQQNSATAQESAAASEEMSSQSDVLQKLIMHFRLKDLKNVMGLTAPSVEMRREQGIPVIENPVLAGNGGEVFGKY